MPASHGGSDDGPAAKFDGRGGAEGARKSSNTLRLGCHRGQLSCTSRRVGRCGTRMQAAGTYTIATTDGRKYEQSR